MAENILLIDLSSIAHQAWHTTSDDPNPDACSIKTIERVRSLASGKPHVAICLDTPPYFRRDIDPDYKANRAKDNNAIIAHQIAVAVDTLRQDYAVFGAKGYEADDVIATAAGRFQLRPDGADGITIASADKDLLQLVSDGVSVLSTHSGNLMDPDAVKEKLGVWPHQVVDYLSLVGDTSDNVKGAKGIGAKRAAEILELFGNLDDAIKATKESIDAADPSTLTAVSRSLLEFAPRLETVRSLIRLRADAPIPFEEIFKARQAPSIEDTHGEHMDDTRPVDRGASIENTAQDRGDSSQIDASPQAEKGQDAKASQTTVEGVVLAKPKPDGPPESTALVQVEWNQALEPRDMRQAAWVAQQLFQSKLFSAYGTPAAVLSTIMAGREMGFSTMASLRAFHIIDNKPTMSAGAIHSLVLRSGKAKFFRCVERTDERVVFETQRGDDPPMSITYTIEDAQRAWTKDQSAWNRSGWGKHPADMLVARCSSKLARLVYPDVCHGLYAEEELG